MRRNVLSLPATRLILLLLGLAVLATAAFFVTAQDRLIFEPYSERVEWPASVAAQHEEHFIRTADGETLRVWWVEGGGAGPVVLGFGGNAARLDGQVRSRSQFLPLERAMVLFEYRGYGASTGTPSESGLIADADAVYEWVVGTRGVQPHDLVLWGNSLGGAVAADLALRRPVGGLILWATFTSLAAVGSHNYPFPAWLIDLFVNTEFETAAKLQANPPRFPVLLFHGRGDSIVPFEHAEQLMEILDGRAELVTHSGGHNNWGKDLDRERRLEVVARFFDRVREAAE